MAPLTAPLAAAGISLFAVATFDTDYMLVKASDVENAVAALRAAGLRPELPDGGSALGSGGMKLGAVPREPARVAGLLVRLPEFAWLSLSVAGVVDR
jgi:hypothetical protein